MFFRFYKIFRLKNSVLVAALSSAVVTRAVSPHRVAKCAQTKIKSSDPFTTGMHFRSEYQNTTRVTYKKSGNKKIKHTHNQYES